MCNLNMARLLVVAWREYECTRYFGRELKMNNNQISYLNSSHKTQPAGETSMYRQNPNVTKKKGPKLLQK
jgi:hypothetical protein